MYPHSQSRNSDSIRHRRNTAPHQTHPACGAGLSHPFRANQYLDGIFPKALPWAEESRAVGAGAACVHPVRMESLSPGSRGTSHPGSLPMNLPLFRPAATLSPAPSGGEGRERGRLPVQGFKARTLVRGILSPTLSPLVPHGAREFRQYWPVAPGPKRTPKTAVDSLELPRHTPPRVFPPVRKSVLRAEEMH